MFVHFSGSTFLAPYLHQFSEVVQKIHFFGAILDKYALHIFWYKSSIINKKIYA
jgi:hypothetical protein